MLLTEYNGTVIYCPQLFLIAIYCCCLLLSQFFQPFPAISNLITPFHAICDHLSFSVEKVEELLIFSGIFILAFIRIEEEPENEMENEFGEPQNVMEKEYEEPQRMNEFMIARPVFVAERRFQKQAKRRRLRLEPKISHVYVGDQIGNLTIFSIFLDILFTLDL